MKPIKYKYKFDPNYNPKYVNGAYGGVSSLGEIVVHFYLERIALPEYQEEVVHEDNGVLRKEIVSVEPKDLQSSAVRFVDSGLILNIETAKSIHSWLGDQINKYEELVKIQTSDGNK